MLWKTKGAFRKMCFGKKGKWKKLKKMGKWKSYGNGPLILILILCLKLKWPRHQRHLLLKWRTNIDFLHTYSDMDVAVSRWRRRWRLRTRWWWWGLQTYGGRGGNEPYPHTLEGLDSKASSVIWLALIGVWNSKRENKLLKLFGFNLSNLNFWFVIRHLLKLRSFLIRLNKMQLLISVD